MPRGRPTQGPAPVMGYRQARQHGKQARDQGYQDQPQGAAAQSRDVLHAATRASAYWSTFALRLRCCEPWERPGGSLEYLRPAAAVL